MTYNKIRYLKLLKCFLDYKNQDKDLYRENGDEYMELLHYRGRLEDHTFWNNKEQFILLMENYAHNSIDFEHFEIAFSRLWKETMEEDEEYTKQEVKDYVRDTLQEIQPYL